MKLKRRSQNTNSSSMADVAFLLVIFFLVTSTIDSKTGLGIVLPDDGKVNVDSKNLLTAYLNKKQILINNIEVAEYELSEIFNNAYQENKKIMLSIRTVRETNYENYIKVLDEARHAGIKKISILGE